MRMENGVETAMRKEIDELSRMTVGQLRQKYLEVFGEESRSNHKQFLFRRIAWRIQALAEGGLSERARRRALEIANDADLRIRAPKTKFGPDVTLDPKLSVSRKVAGALDPRLPPPGTYLEREYKGRRVIAKVLVDGFEFDGEIYRSLSAIAQEATGTKWNGFLFFNLTVHGGKAQWQGVALRRFPPRRRMDRVKRKTVRCAIYTRKSTEEGLQQEFNSLDAQREASEAFVASQKHEGWQVITEHFDDGGYTGGNMDRPALKRLLAAVEARSVDCIVVYKVDRLSRSLLDFARIIEVFDRNGVSFVAVTQQFNTTSSLGRLTLNILLSFAQFEREIISERTRDKMSAARRKGKWIGGHPVLGYDIDSKGGRIIVNPAEAEQVRTLFGLYMAKGSTLPVLQETQRGRSREQAVDHRRRQGPGWKTIHQRIAARDPDQRPVHRNG